MLFAKCEQQGLRGYMLNPLKATYIFLEKYVLNQNTPWLLLLVCALLLSVMPIHYLIEAPLTTTIPVAAPAFKDRQLANNMLLLLHVLLAIAPLALGPWLFHRGFRADRPALHRLMGKIYVVCVLLSAATSFPLALSHPSGSIPRVGFGFLAVAWFSFTLLAYHYARKKSFVEHRRWMFRSFACTFAFVNVKAYAYLLIMFGSPLHPLIVKILQSCFSWMSNLFLVEIYLAATTYLGVYVGRKLFLKHLRTLPLKVAIVMAVFLSSIWISATYFPVDTTGTRFDLSSGIMMRPREPVLQP